MIRYEKLPKKTSPATVAGVLMCGLGLSFGLVISSILAAYCLVAVFAHNVYGGFDILIIGPRQAIFFFGLFGVAAVTTTTLGFLAYYMDKLSKKALPLSRVMLLPTALLALLTQWQHNSSHFSYHISSAVVMSAWLSVIVAGILPALFLSTKGARKLHSR